MLSPITLTNDSSEVQQEDDDLTFETEEDEFDLDDDLADDDFANDNDCPAAPTRIPAPFEDNPDDDPADADPNHKYDDDGTGPSFDY